jgi:hypothetical protein
MDHGGVGVGIQLAIADRAGSDRGSLSTQWSIVRSATGLTVSVLDFGVSTAVLWAAQRQYQQRVDHRNGLAVAVQRFGHERGLVPALDLDGKINGQLYGVRHILDRTHACVQANLRPDRNRGG